MSGDIQHRITMDTIDIYTDGAFSSRTKTAGMGVVFPADRSLDLSEFFNLKQPTNQRAELLAVSRALEVVLTKYGPSAKVVLHTDSKYTIGCYVDWWPNWHRNGWKNAKGKDVENQDIIRRALELIQKFKEGGGSVAFKHVRAHVGHEFNEAADKLARQGAGFA